MNVYFTNTTVEIDVNFTDVNGAPADPNVVQAFIMTPDGVSNDVSGNIVRGSIGYYFVQYIPSQLGLHQYRVQGTGVVNASVEGAFFTQTSFGWTLQPNTATATISGTSPVESEFIIPNTATGIISGNAPTRTP